MSSLFQLFAVIAHIRDLKIVRLNQRFLGSQPPGVVPLDSELVAVPERHAPRSVVVDRVLLGEG